jgi:miniconductance mechanosensitive channel
MHSINDPAIWLKELFINAGLSYDLSLILSTTGLVLIVLFLSWLSNLVTKTIIHKIVVRIVKRTTSTWDDVFLEEKVFTRLSHFAPALVIWFMAGWALKAYPGWLDAARKLTYIYMVAVGMVVVNSWVPFENLQSEIIEHLLAVLNEFELKVFQQPTGDNLKVLSGTN